MDTFIDKLAQKLTAQEMIKANSAADAAELSFLREQMAEYEDLLKDIQNESSINKESAEKLQQYVNLTEKSSEKIERNLSFVEKYAIKTEQNAAVVEQTANAMSQQVKRMEQTAERSEAGVAKLEQSATIVESSADKVEQNAARAEELINAGIAKIESLKIDSKNSEEMKALLSELQKVQTEQFVQLSDHVHRENVKVYRNVQAVVIEENDKQNENYGKNLDSMSKKMGILMAVSVISLLASCAGLAFQILQYLNIL